MKKKANTIFAEVKQLVQHLQSAITEQRKIWDSITLVVALDSLHYDFEMTTAPLLHSGNKDIDKIRQIVNSTEVANLAKRAVAAIADLTMMAKKKQLKRSDLKKNERYFNCGRKGHYAKDCHSSTRNFIKKISVEVSTKEAKQS